MAGGNQNQDKPDDLAILATVLAAENAAADKLDQARQQASDIALRAREMARLIEARTDQRLQKLHADLYHATKDRNAALTEAFAIEKTAWEAGDRSCRVEQATKLLAARMIGLGSA